MADWAYIENGQIVEKYENLPDNWRNISNFYVLKDNIDYLRTLNWYPIVHTRYEYDPTTKKLDNHRYKIEGNTVIEECDIVDIPSPPTPSLIDVEKMLIESTQARLDIFAQTRGYDNILSACSYNVDPDPTFKKEGTYCVQIRSQTWIKMNQIISDIRNEKRSMPTRFVDIEQELPLLEWPE